MSTTRTHRLALVPRDGFFVKDGRGWSTSARTHVLDWPWPTTIRGALTTVSGKIAEQRDQREPRRFERKDWTDHQKLIAIGALVPLRRTQLGGPWSRMWPVPADALWLEGEDLVQPLQPEPPETSTLGRTAPEGHAEAREALWVAQVESNAKPLGRPRWWDEATLVKWLCGENLEAKSLEQYPRMASRLQVHVGIRADTLTGDDGILYAHDVIETLERRTPDGEGGKREVAEWAFGAEVTWPLDAVPDGKVARLGSDSRIAWIEAVEDNQLFEMPPLLRSAFREGSAGLRLMVVTPACFKGGWLPDGFEPVQEGGEWVFRGRLPRPNGAPHAAIYDSELILRAAFVPRPMHVSGWDMASDKGKGGAARATSRLVPPGAVYFFKSADGRRFTGEDAEALWLAALGSRTNEGFGRVVPGMWNPEDPE